MCCAILEVVLSCQCNFNATEMLPEGQCATILHVCNSVKEGEIGGFRPSAYVVTLRNCLTLHIL